MSFSLTQKVAKYVWDFNTGCARPVYIMSVHAVAPPESDNGARIQQLEQEKQILQAELDSMCQGTHACTVKLLKVYAYIVQ